jgi:phage repressor protein C with HTH and peptisase S24 domain
MKEAINQRFIDTVYYLIAEKKDLNKSKIASEIEIQPSKFSEILNKRMNIGIDSIVLFCEKFSISVEWLLTGKGTRTKEDSIHYLNEPGGVYTLKTDRVLKEQSIPLYDLEASAGVVELFTNKNGLNKPIDYISIPNLPKCDGAIYVTGDSMYPLLKSGDIIMYKELENSIDNIFFGEMYLVSINLDGDEFVTVKWIHKSDKGDEFIKIVSQNSHHQSKDIHLSNIKAMALIKASIRINSMS